MDGTLETRVQVAVRLQYAAPHVTRVGNVARLVLQGNLQERSQELTQIKYNTLHIKESQ